MPRLEVELTSARPDGTWTWRKAGARQPKGAIEASLMPDGVKVGDVLRVEGEALIDGFEITSVLPPKAERKDRFERIEIKGRPAPEQLVSTTLAPKREKRSGRDGDRRRPDRGDRGDRADRGGRSDRSARGERRDRPAHPRPPELEIPDRPKPKRLRPGRAHRSEVLKSLAPEEQAIAEQVLAGGVPAVRQAVEQQNTTNREAGLPEIKGDELVGLAETLLPALRAAEWRDRADGALAIVDEIDLRDLRSVVVAAETVRGDDTREIESTLREALNRRVEQEHEAWLEELRLTLAADRSVRALRLSSRPPKAGAPLPPDLAERLAAVAASSMTADTSTDRWATVLDALAVSPVRNAVKPLSIPDPVPEKLKEAVLAVATRLPHIAEAFGIDPADVKPPSRKRRPASNKAGANQPPRAKRIPSPGRGPKPDVPPAKPAQVPDSASEGAEKGPSPVSSDAPRIAAPAVTDEPVAEAPTPETAEAETEAPTPETAEAETEAPTPETAEAETEAPTPETAEAETEPPAPDPTAAAPVASESTTGDDEPSADGQ